MLQEALEGRARTVTESTFIGPSEFAQPFLTSDEVNRGLINSEIVQKPQPVRRRNLQNEIMPPSRTLTKSIGASRMMRSMDFVATSPEKIYQPGNEQLAERLGQLKSQQLLFKVKTRVGSLLRHLELPHSRLSRFDELNRLEDILSCLSDNVKQVIAEKDINSKQGRQARVRDLEKVTQMEIKLQSTQRELEQKESVERGMKSKLKETNSELRELYDQLNMKEKTLSDNSTELYRTRVQLKEAERLVETFRTRNYELEMKNKQANAQRSAKDQGVESEMQTLLAENDKLVTRVKELEEEREVWLAKDRQMNRYNEQIQEELIRWRGRFETEVDQRANQIVKIKEKEWEDRIREEIGEMKESEEKLVNNIKESTACMSQSLVMTGEGQNTKLSSQAVKDIERTKLFARVKELEKQNKHLKRELINSEAFRTKFQEKVTDFSGMSSHLDHEKNLDSLASIQAKKESEKLVREWKDKLFEIVYKYEDELDALKEQVNLLTLEKQRLEKKVKNLATQNHDTQSRLIKKQSMLLDSELSRREPVTLEKITDGLTTSMDLAVSSQKINSLTTVAPEPASKDNIREQLGMIEEEGQKSQLVSQFEAN